MRKMKTRFIVPMSMACALWSFNVNGREAGQAPAVFWASSPVRPNEAVYFQGNGLDDGVKLEVARVADGASESSGWHGVTALQPAGTSVKFVLPADFAPGVYVARISGKAGTAEVLLNTPDFWWMQGDLGNAKASPGGWLRLFGRSLNLGQKTSEVLLRAESGKETQTQIPAEKSDGCSLAIEIPKGLAPGKYGVRLSNGYGGEKGFVDAGTVEIVARFVWPEKVYDVTDHGANPHDGLDDAPAIQAALDEAGKNGGGVVYLPSGQYHLGAMLNVPPMVTLRGESMETVAMQWTDMGATETKDSDGAVGSGGSAVVKGFQMFKTGEPFQALIKGTDNFRVEELALYAWAHFHGIEGERWNGKGNIHIKRVRMRLYAEAINYGRAYKSIPEEVRLRRERVKGLWMAGFQAGGENVSVTDCDIGCGEGHAIIIDRGHGVVLSRNRSDSSVFLKGVRGVIFEDNQCRGYWPSTHYSANDTFRRNGKGGVMNTYAEMIYMARNQAHDVWAGDREITSLDSHGPFGFYFGGVAGVKGTQLTVKENNADGTPAKLGKGTGLAGAAVYILDGRGAGQYRRVVSVADDFRTLIIEQPFQVEPDGTSVISVAKYHGKLLYVDDSFTDGGDVQLWGGAVNAVFKNVSMTRCGGYNQTTGFIFGGLIPLWYFEQFNTHVIEGNNPGGPPFKLRPAILSMNTYRHPSFYKGPIIRGAVNRHAVSENNATIELAGAVDGAVVENCLIKKSQTGVLLRTSDSHYLAGKPEVDPNASEKRSPSNILLRDNRFELVNKPLAGDAIPAALSLP